MVKVSSVNSELLFQWDTLMHLYTYLHTLLHEDTTILDNCTHNYAYRSLAMDTGVFFLQSVRPQVTWKELILTISNLGGCGGLQRTDFNRSSSRID